jgi:methionine synthase I (cobalamin-dependent)
MPMDFLTFLHKQKTILLDGAMGTELDKRGLMSRGRNNLDAPDAVLEIHQEYARCGCDAITTNTLTMNRICIETMFDLREALCALQACKGNFSLPVIVSIAFATETKGARTIMGNSAQQCAQSLADAGADVIGANCGELDPAQMAAVVSLFRSATTLPIVAQPNAGKPKLAGEKTVFEMMPEPFAAGIAECLRAGARVVGGCCGTTPAHIRAVAAMLDRGNGN